MPELINSRWPLQADAAVLEDPQSVAQTLAPASVSLGFLTILHEPSGYVGGYLVTNAWGRPIEFRLSTAVQPNRLQQILYGGTLQPYVCAELIGKTLVQKTHTPAQIIVTDKEAALELRRHLDIPVAWVADAAVPLTAAFREAGCEVIPASPRNGPVLCHPDFKGDAVPLRAKLAWEEGILDLAEPFSRIRDAIAEARKMGVTGRG